MKTTFHVLKGGTAALAALALALPSAHAQRGDLPATPSMDEKPKDSRKELYETPIPDLQISDGTSLSDLIQILDDLHDIRLNAVFRDKAGEIEIPRLSLQNVSLIDLLEVVESLTDVSADIIGNSPTTNPVIVFRGPKKPQPPQQRATGIGSTRQNPEADPATEVIRNSTALQTARQMLKIDPDMKWSEVVRQVQVRPPQLVDTSTIVRVFPLSKFDAKPEEIIDFIDQILTLGANPKDQKVPSPRTLYHTGTKSLIVRGNPVQVSEIEEALRQLNPEAFEAPLPPGTGASASKDAMNSVRRLFTPKAPTPNHTPNPFGDGGAGTGAGAADPFGTPKKPAKPRPKAAKDPFGGGPATGGSPNPSAPENNATEKPARKAADPFG